MSPLSLTPRRRAVADLLADGWSNDEIAARLGMSLGNVKRIVGLLYAEAGVHDRVRFTAFWLRKREEVA